MAGWSAYCKDESSDQRLDSEISVRCVLHPPGFKSYYFVSSYPKICQSVVCCRRLPKFGSRRRLFIVAFHIHMGSLL